MSQRHHNHAVHITVNSACKDKVESALFPRTDAANTSVVPMRDR